MKFGIKELWFLRDTVMEIARENDIPSEEAVRKFLSDVELQYNNKLGFQSKIDSLRSEVNRLRGELLSLPQVAPKLVKLSQSGVSEQDIINIAAVFEKYVAGKDRQSFVSELKAYGGLKSAIQELSKQADKMRTELGSLQTQNRDLNADNKLIKGSLRISEIQNKPMEAERDCSNIPKDDYDEVQEREEFAALMPLIKAD